MSDEVKSVIGRVPLPASNAPHAQLDYLHQVAHEIAEFLHNLSVRVTYLEGGVEQGAKATEKKFIPWGDE